LGAALSNLAGHTSLEAGRDLVQGADVTASAAGRTLDLVADRSVTMVAGVAAQASVVRYEARRGDIVVGDITADTSIELIAPRGSILDLSSDSGAVNLRAPVLILGAGNAIGQAGNALETAVDKMAAQARAGGIHITETDGMTIDQVMIGYSRVQTDGSAIAQSRETLSGLSVLDGGDIELNVLAGDLRLNAGSAGGAAVSVQGAGNILLSVLQGSAAVNAPIQSGSGHIALKTYRDITWGSEGRFQSSDPAAEGILTLAPVDPTQNIVIGTAPTSPGDNTWYFDPLQLERLGAGYASIVIGGDNHTGNITIDGSATPVSFLNPVQIRAAAQATIGIKGQVDGVSLSVSGAASVAIDNATVTMSGADGISIANQTRIGGHVVLQATSVSFGGGTGSIRAAASDAKLVLLPLDATQAVVIGSQAASRAGFRIDATALQALADGFAGIEIGHASQQAQLWVEGEARFSDAVVLWGSQVTMAAGSAIISTGDVTIAANQHVLLGEIRAVGRTVSVRTQAQDAVIQSVLGSDKVNIVAQQFVLSGYGPLLGAAAQALRVDSSEVSVLTPSGLVQRQTLSDGTVRFVVMVNGQVHHQLVNVHTQVVGSGSVQGLVLPSIQPTAFARQVGAIAQLQVASSLFSSASASSASTSAFAASRSSVSAVVAPLASADIVWQSNSNQADTIDLGRYLTDAYLLGDPSVQPVSAGMLSHGTASFNYWVENISL
ncbi:hypothetical protein, partial [Malikia spinosa]|uniref:hypothetical protein n=1 Tax=Malikia spinosa TaxID=86180 RepID=UPI002FD8CEA6